MTKTRKGSSRLGKIAIGAASMLLSIALHAQDRAFEIPAGDLKAALDSYIATTGRQVLYKDADLKGRSTKGVHGNMTPEQALTRLLEGANLKVRTDSSGAVLITADDTKSAEVSSLDSIYVFGKALAHIGDFARTGTRTDADPMTLPMTVESVDKELLQQQQVITLRDAVANVAGASELNSDGSFVMRGFSAGVMRNGNMQAGGLGFDAPLVSIARVEVVKGPEAIISGVTGTGYGGVVNVISKTPELQPVTEVTGMFGSHGYYETGIDVNRAVTEDKSLLVRFVASKRGTGTALNGYDGTDKKYAAPSITWRNKGSGTELTAQYEYQQGHTAPDLSVFTDKPSLGDDLKLVRLGPKESGTDKRNTITTLSGTQRLSEDWELGFKYSDDRSSTDLKGLLSGVGTAFGYPYPSIISFHAHTAAKYETRSGKIELKGNVDTGPVEHKLLLAYDSTTSQVQGGAQYTAVTVTDLDTGAATDVSDVLGPLFGGLPTPFSSYKVRTKETGLLVMDHVTYGRWVGLAGWREIRFDPDDLTSEPHDKLKKSLPSLGVVYRMTQQTSFYGNASKGYSPNVATFDINGNALPPEDAQQYELGVKMQFPQQKMAFSVAWFSIDQKNVAIPDPAHTTDICGIGTCYITVPGLRSRGIELELSGEIYKGLGIRANYSYTRRADKDDIASVVAYARQQASVWAVYKFGNEAIGNGWWVGAGVQGRSARNKFPDATDADNPGYGRIDANAGYQTKNWSVTFGGKNLADKRAYILGSGIGGNGVVQQPREFYLTARYNFD